MGKQFVKLWVIATLIGLAVGQNSYGNLIASNVGAVTLQVYDTGTINCDGLICPTDTFKCSVDLITNDTTTATSRICFNATEEELDRKEDSKPTPAGNKGESHTRGEADANGKINVSKMSQGKSITYSSFSSASANRREHPDEDSAYDDTSSPDPSSSPVDYMYEGSGMTIESSGSSSLFATNSQPGSSARGSSSLSSSDVSVNRRSEIEGSGIGSQNQRSSSSGQSLTLGGESNFASGLQKIRGEATGSLMSRSSTLSPVTNSSPGPASTNRQQAPHRRSAKRFKKSHAKYVKALTSKKGNSRPSSVSTSAAKEFRSDALAEFSVQSNTATSNSLSSGSKTSRSEARARSTYSNAKSENQQQNDDLQKRVQDMVEATLERDRKMQDSMQAKMERSRQLDR